LQRSSQLHFSRDCSSAMTPMTCCRRCRACRDSVALAFDLRRVLWCASRLHTVHWRWLHLGLPAHFRLLVTPVPCLLCTAIGRWLRGCHHHARTFWDLYGYKLGATGALEHASLLLVLLKALQSLHAH
jgi:hypothetical protein